MGAETNVVTLEFPGTRLDVDLASFNGVDWRDAKRATGLHDKQLVLDAIAYGDRDATAALAWLHLRRDDPEITYEATLRQCHYGPAPPSDDDED